MRIACLSGGTGGNAIVPVLQALSDNHTSYILPCSDNGGSTSEILRVLGGPGVGDLRSRLVRLIPDDEIPPLLSSAEIGQARAGHQGRTGDERLAATRRLLSHRLSVDSVTARLQFFDLLEARDPDLYAGISRERAQALRSYLIVFQGEVAKLSSRTRPFDFSNGSVGNFVLTGMRLFFGSVETAVFVLGKLAGIPEHADVLPIIETVEGTPIAATLEDGTVIAGQNEISHPSASPAVSGTHFSAGSIHFDKDTIEPLRSRIREISYIDQYGQRIVPVAAPACIKALAAADCIIFAPGSLYTSLVPLLLPVGTAGAVRNSKSPKILLLNGTHDRETPAYSANDYLNALCRACGTGTTWREICTHLVYLRNPSGSANVPTVDEAILRNAGIIPMPAQPDRVALQSQGLARYDLRALQKLLATILTSKPILRRSTVSYSGTPLESNT
ncbi:hypothetical protein PYCC9005_004817 [Savitreella phatthalungensis]